MIVLKLSRQFLIVKRLANVENIVSCIVLVTQGLILTLIKMNLTINHKLENIRARNIFLCSFTMARGLKIKTQSKRSQI